LDRTPSKIQRAFRALVKAGELVVLESNRRLKRGKGTAPTVLRITNYETYCFTAAEARYHFKASGGTKERTEEKESRLEKGSLRDCGKNLEEIPEAARDVMNSVRNNFAPSRRLGKALEIIAAELNRGATRAQMERAAISYRRACLDQGLPSSAVPEIFFASKWQENYPDS